VTRWIIQHEFRARCVRDRARKGGFSWLLKDHSGQAKSLYNAYFCELLLMAQSAPIAFGMLSSYVTRNAQVFVVNARPRDAI